MRHCKPAIFSTNDQLQLHTDRRQRSEQAKIIYLWHFSAENRRMHPCNDKQNWFKFEGDDPACVFQFNAPPAFSNYCGFQGYGLQEEPNDKDKWAADGSSDPAYFSMKWEAGRQLYEKLLRQPSLVNYSSTISAFYTAASNGAIGQYTTFQQQFADLYKLPSDIESSYFSILNSWQSKGADLKELEEKMKITDVNSSEFKVYMQQRSTLLMDLQSQVGQLFAYDAHLKVEYNNRLAALYLANQNLPGTQACQVNERAINDILLKLYQTDDWVIDNSTRTIIDNIAIQCPLAGGRAVYTARSLQSLYKQPDWSQDHCMSVSERSSTILKPLGNTTLPQLFPVPASNYLNVQFERPLSENIDMRIIDSRGQIVKTISIYSDIDTYTVDVSDLPNGLYFAAFQSTELGHSVQRFSVMK